MANDLRFNREDSSDEVNDLDYLSEHECLKSYYVPLTRQRNSHVPLGLRRSVSLEDTSIETNLQNTKSQNCWNLSLPNSKLSSSLNSLCFRFQAHQLYQN